MISKISALILFFSDDPERFNYFTDPFLARINDESKIQFIEDRNIKEQFLLNLMIQKSPSTLQKEMIESTQKIKNHIEKKQYHNAYAESAGIVKKFQIELLNNPYEIPRKILLPFYFWNTIAHLDYPESRIQFLDAFLRLATVEDRNRLESMLTPKDQQNFRRILDEYRALPLLLYSIKNNKKCLIFLNGERLRAAQFWAAGKSQNILNAACQNGFYSQQVNGISEKNIQISPQIIKNLSEMPTLEWFPYNLMEKNKTHAIVFLYWSKEKQTLEAVLFNLLATEKREVLLHLKRKADLQMAGDDIEQFIFNSSKYLIELNPS